jgi:hypothetical protein
VSIDDMTPLHEAVEMEDLERLRDLLDAGGDVEEVANGLTLLQHAVDVEIDGHTQTGEALHVDTTAYLLARGADPTRGRGGAEGPLGSAQHMALVRGHWLATALIELSQGKRGLPQ